MNIKNMFVSDINRHIDKVIKVDQTTEDILYQEITEYVITKEIRRNFNDFFNAYEKSIDYPNDNIGVWISGFFGSGKSHFLKMLSYLLANKEVKGKKTIEYFKDKFNDPMMYATVEKCLRKKADAIMFDIFYIGQATGGKLDLVTIFAKQFYDYLGYYGTDLKVAKFEKFLDDQGKYEQFKENFYKINGAEWNVARDTFVFFEDDIVEAMVQTTSCTEIAARNWFNNEETSDLNIDKLIDEIKKYVNTKGDDFRLLFMIDEMGMYIGDDTEFMITLQSIVEKLGVKCNGKVWVMVTGQEAIDQVIKVKGNDLSKILARFDIKLKLSSTSVDEVIKKRILGKTEAARDTLKLQYSENSSVLKNLFTFNKAISDLKGYSNDEDFVDSFPFVSYQFIIEQKVLQKIREKQFAGSSLSSGERTMLSAFQFAAIEVQNKDENALVPFYHFYSIVEKDLDHQVRIVFDRCSKAADNNDGIEPYDINVLKLLFLIRNIDDFPHNIDNITTLMIDDIRTDKINLKNIVTKSLERLLSQNYISRNGENYDFLTNAEQEIAREIRAMTIDSSQIIKQIGDIVYGDLYQSKKLKYDKYDFDFDKYVDDTIFNTSSNNIKLRIITQASSLYNAGLSTWMMKTNGNYDAYVVLNSEYKYFDELENAAKIEKYVKTRNVSQLPEAIQQIIRSKNNQANQHKKTAKTSIEKAIIAATFVVNGQSYTPKGSTVKDKLDNTLTYLIESVYNKLPLIKYNYSYDDEIMNILNNNGLQLNTKSSNEDAINEVEGFLSLQQAQFLPTSMYDILKRFEAIPYGWREIDIAACVAELIKEQKIQLKVTGNVISPFDKNIINYLRKKSEVDRVLIEKRKCISDDIIRKTKNILKDYFEEMDVPSKEDDLAKFIIESLNKKINDANEYISYYTRANYPQRNVMEKSIVLYKDILSNQKDNEKLFNSIINNENELFDLNDELSDLISFFNNQVKVFDDGLNKINSLKDEKSHLQVSPIAINAYNCIETILSMERPYSRLKEIPNYIQEIDKVYNDLLNIKKEELIVLINNIKDKLQDYKNENNISKYNFFIEELNNKILNINNSSKMTILGDIKSNLSDFEIKATTELISITNDANESIKTKVYQKNILFNSKVINKNNLNDYINEIKEKLNQLLEENDEIHII